MFNKKALALTGLSMLGNVMHGNATIKSTSTVVTVKKAEKSTARRVAENIATSPITHLILAVLVGQGIDAGANVPYTLKTSADGKTWKDVPSSSTNLRTEKFVQYNHRNYNPIESLVRWLSYSKDARTKYPAQNKFGQAIEAVCEWI